VSLDAEDELREEPTRGCSGNSIAEQIGDGVHRFEGPVMRSGSLGRTLEARRARSGGVPTGQCVLGACTTPETLPRNGGDQADRAGFPGGPRAPSMWERQTFFESGKRWRAFS
jgi:hypothetical protein